jgi:hypothetical protein
MNHEYVGGYKIISSVGFTDDIGFAIGFDQQAAFPYTTWKFYETGGKRIHYNGHYFVLENADVAKLDFKIRVDDYRTANPDVAEKYNHLASAEMSVEGNYNMIDGIINNVKKPSVLEQMKEYERRIAQNALAHSEKQKSNRSNKKENQIR